MSEPQHVDDVDEKDLAIFREQQKTKRLLINWGFAAGIFASLLLTLIIAGISA